MRLRAQDVPMRSPEDLDTVLNMTVDDALSLALQKTENQTLDPDWYEGILAKLGEVEKDAFTLGLASKGVRVEAQLKEDVIVKLEDIVKARGFLYESEYRDACWNQSGEIVGAVNAWIMNSMVPLKRNPPKGDVSEQYKKRIKKNLNNPDVLKMGASMHRTARPLTMNDKKVIENFIDKIEGESPRLLTDGTKLETIGFIGSATMAVWKDDKIVFSEHVPSSRFEQSIVNYIEKGTPKAYLTKRGQATDFAMEQSELERAILAWQPKLPNIKEWLDKVRKSQTFADIKRIWDQLWHTKEETGPMVKKTQPFREEVELEEDTGPALELASLRKAQAMLQRKAMDQGIVDGMARAMFVLEWAEQEEARGTSFSGMDIEQVAPPTPPEAYQAALELSVKIEDANPDRPIEVPEGADAEEFGFNLALEALGTGARWSDSHEDHGYEIPNFEWHWEGGDEDFGDDLEETASLHRRSLATDKAVLEGMSEALVATGVEPQAAWDAILKYAPTLEKANGGKKIVPAQGGNPKEFGKYLMEEALSTGASEFMGYKIPPFKRQAFDFERGTIEKGTKVEVNGKPGIVQMLSGQRAMVKLEDGGQAWYTLNMLKKATTVPHEGPDWEILKIDKSERSTYRIEGINHNYSEDDINRKFFWHVDSVSDPRYFASPNIEITPAAQKLLDAAGETIGGGKKRSAAEDEGEFGIRWFEYNKKDQKVMKQKFFSTKEARDKFVEKLEQKDNFANIDAWLDEKQAATELSHQERIAIKTLLMADAMVDVMGGMSKEEAAKVLGFGSVEQATKYAEKFRKWRWN